jgi:hypothetical protein
MSGSWYLCDVVLDRLAQNLKHMAAELRQFIQEAHALVRPRPLAWRRDVPAADQPHVQEGVMGRATRARRDEGGACAWYRGP